MPRHYCVQVCSELFSDKHNPYRLNNNRLADLLTRESVPLNNSERSCKRLHDLQSKRSCEIKNCIFNENYLQNERMHIIWINELSEHVHIFFIASTFRVNDCYATIRSVNNNDEKILKWLWRKNARSFNVSSLNDFNLGFFLSLKCKTQINANINFERRIVLVSSFGFERDKFFYHNALCHMAVYECVYFNRSLSLFWFFPHTLS